MKILKKENYTGSLRKIVGDNDTSVIGIIGTVEDMLKENVFVECDECPKRWVFLNKLCVAIFRDSREEILEAIK